MKRAHAPIDAANELLIISLVVSMRNFLLLKLVRALIRPSQAEMANKLFCSIKVTKDVSIS